MGEYKIVGEKGNATMPKTKNTKPKMFSKPLLKIVLFAIGVAIFSIVVWKFLTGDNKPQDPAISYLTNGNNVVCIVEANNLKCEHILTGELKNYAIPSKYNETSVISSSPSEAKLLVEMNDKDVVVTDTNFEEIRKVFDGTNAVEQNSSFSWADDSSILISETRREENDADFLPAPLVIHMFNVETGEKRRIYKTGENVDTKSIKVIGSNNTYLFISHQLPKNWVAIDTDPPSPAINAIRLADGFVLPVNSHQVSTDNIYYDADKDVFLSTRYRDGGSENGYITASQLEESEFGLLLRSKLEINATSIDTMDKPIITSRGVLLSINTGTSTLFKLVQDNGTITELKLKSNNPYSRQSLSLKTFPELPQ